MGRSDFESDEYIMSKIMEKFDLTEQKAKGYLENK